MTRNEAKAEVRALIRRACPRTTATAGNYHVPSPWRKAVDWNTLQRRLEEIVDRAGRREGSGAGAVEPSAAGRRS